MFLGGKEGEFFKYPAFFANIFINGILKSLVFKDGISRAGCIFEEKVAFE